jgi:hypothetical protein
MDNQLARNQAVEPLRCERSQDTQHVGSADITWGSPHLPERARYIARARNYTCHNAGAGRSVSLLHD